MGVKGALQAAIDESSINSTFDELSDTVIARRRLSEPGRGQGSVYTAAPGYLIQSDAGGAGQHPDDAGRYVYGARLRGADQPRRGGVCRAWCEAVVQRGINYVDP